MNTLVTLLLAVVLCVSARNPLTEDRAEELSEDFEEEMPEDFEEDLDLDRGEDFEEEMSEDFDEEMPEDFEEDLDRAEDFEEEMLEDFEEEMSEDLDRSLETEEKEDRAAATETKECGAWTALQPVMIGAGEKKCFYTASSTKRCIMRYKEAATCKEMKLTCSKLRIDNGPASKDYPPLCREGDKLIVKSDNRVKKFCGKQYNQLTNFLPAYSRNLMKVWFIPHPDHKKYNSDTLACCMTCEQDA